MLELPDEVLHAEKVLLIRQPQQTLLIFFRTDCTAPCWSQITLFLPEKVIDLDQKCVDAFFFSLSLFLLQKDGAGVPFLVHYYNKFDLFFVS